LEPKQKLSDHLSVVLCGVNTGLLLSLISAFWISWWERKCTRYLAETWFGNICIFTLL